MTDKKKSWEPNIISIFFIINVCCSSVSDMTSCTVYLLYHYVLRYNTYTHTYTHIYTSLH